MANYIPGIDKSKKFLNDNVQPLISDVLGIKDEGELAIKQAKQSAKERTNMGIVNQDAYEDTLRHMLLGAYTTSESSFPNPIDLGKRIGGALINFRELGEGYEGNIDVNNNNMGKLLAEFRLSKKGGGLRGNALKKQILEDAKMLAASVDKTFTSSKSDSPEKKEMRDYLYSENGLMDRLDSFLGSDKSINTMKPKLSTTGRSEEFFKMNQGGIVDNQMVKAFAIGGEVTDPISGNEVPEGSFPNEVRDDVPAMLSEGEYVVPADVLRFYGLKFFEDLRENAKMELQRMSQDGRMGGEPVQESQSLTDTDVTSLERMMRNANNGSKGDIVEMAKGGLIDKLAHTIKTDNGVNQRLAKGGVVIKMAPGGLVSSSLYQDPTKMDEVIKEVTAASKTNPALFQRLASKGVVLDKTDATMDSEEMLDKNKPMFNLETGKELVTAADGTFINPTNNMFYNPDMFKPKEKTTSTGTFQDSNGNTITVRYEIVNGIKMMTGYSRDNDPEKRLFPIPIPEGFSRVETSTGSELDNLTVAKPEPGIGDAAYDDQGNWLGAGNESDLARARDQFINRTLTGTLTKADKLFSKMGLVKGLTAIDKLAFEKIRGVKDTTPFSRAVTRLRSEVIKMKKDDPAYKARNTLLDKVNAAQDKKQREINAKDPSIGGPDGDVTSGGVTSGVGTGGTGGGIGLADEESQGNYDFDSDDTDYGTGTVDYGNDYSSEAEAEAEAAGYGFALNKGGLASKKSKKSYDKGGYYTNKKMNTGGLVKKKKKK